MVFNFFYSSQGFTSISLPLWGWGRWKWPNTRQSESAFPGFQVTIVSECPLFLLCFCILLPVFVNYVDGLFSCIIFKLSFLSIYRNEKESCCALFLFILKFFERVWFGLPVVMLGFPVA